MVQATYAIELQHSMQTDCTDKNRIHPQPHLAVGLTWRLTACIVTCLFGCLLSAGYNVGVLNIPQEMMMDFCNSSMVEVFGYYPSDASLDIVWSSVVAVFLVGAMAGSLTAGPLADRHGRKTVVMMTQLLMFVSAAILTFSYSFNRIEVFLIGRTIVGYNTGLATTISSLYLHEVAPFHLEGALGTVTNFGCCTGMLIGMITGLPQILGSPERCWMLMGAFILLTLIGLATLPFCPESPKYLFSINRESDAINALSLLRNRPVAQLGSEIDQCKSECKLMTSAEEWSLWKLVTNVTTRGKLFVLVIACSSQQFAGINAIMLFSTSIFIRAGLTASSSAYATIGCMAVQCAVALCAGAVIARFAIRKLLAASCLGCAVFLSLFAATISLLDVYDWATTTSMVAILMYIVFFALGLGPVPWLLGSFMFEQGPRSLAVSVGTGSIWLSSFVTVLLFPPLYSILGNWCFSFFIVCALIGGVVSYMFIPHRAANSSSV